MSGDALSRVVVVLDHPKDVVNIAGVVRVMMHFGLSDLRLVEPDEFDTWRIGGIAHRSQPLTEKAQVFATLDDALADATFVVGTTARARTAGRTYVRPAVRARAVVPTTKLASASASSRVSKIRARSVSGWLRCAIPPIRHVSKSSGSTRRSSESPKFIMTRTTPAMFTTSLG